jgi:hypothetical protein
MRQLLSRGARKTMICGWFAARAGNLRHLREAALQPLAAVWLDAAVPRARVSSRRSVQEMAKGRAAAKKVSCEECYFRCNLLCALDLDEPCATFRPDHPDGLRPPRQLRFTFRQERRTQAAWAFPTAQEQAALHR